MTVATPEKVHDAIKKAGSTYILDLWGDHLSTGLDKASQKINDFAEEYHKRFGEDLDPFVLLENPIKAAAFFQFDTFLLSAEMMVAVYRILIGCEIIAVQFEYQAASNRVEFRIELRTPYGDTEIYRAQSLNDFKIMRHIGSTIVGGSLQLEGYYALRRA